MLCASMARAQKVYTTIQYAGTPITSLGTAGFTTKCIPYPTVEFDANGNVVMTKGENTIVFLPTKDSGKLVMEFTTQESEENINKVSKTVSNNYSTMYSPFQLQVPEGDGVEVYAPTYNSNTHSLMLNNNTKINPGAVIPVGTGLILKNNGSYNFAISEEEATAVCQSALSGSAVKIDNPTKSGEYRGNTVYTLGHGKQTGKYGFFAYVGAYLNPGLAYLYVPTIPAENSAKGISFNFGEDDETTAISDLNNGTLTNSARKALLNGKVVIIKGNMKYNLNGQEVK